MKSWGAALSFASMSLVGCTSQGEEAEKRYQIVARAGDASAKCEVGREVAAAYLSDQNEKKYRWWKLSSDIDCQTAELRNSQVN